MDGRVRIHTLVQQIHLISSMIMLSIMLVYSMTGIIIINHDLFRIPEIQTSHSEISVERRMNGDPDDYARYLKKRYDFRGRTEFIKDKRDNWVFHFNIPGEGYQVNLPPEQDTL